MNEDISPDDLQEVDELVQKLLKTASEDSPRTSVGLAALGQAFCNVCIYAKFTPDLYRQTLDEMQELFEQIYRVLNRNDTNTKTSET